MADRHDSSGQTFMALLGFIASLFGAGCKPPPTTPTTPPPEADAMKALRTMMLTTPASKAGIQPTERFPKVFGIVMDMPISGGHTATVVSMCDGHASLYTTSTFGVLGGIGHESVRTASTNFVAIAQAHYDEASLTVDFPYPAADHVRFYLLGFDGVRVIDTQSASVETRGARSSAMWLAGQQVLTELRLITEKK
jgi:hypothetical protein